MTQVFGDPESYHGYSVDDEDQPQSFGDSLVDDRGLREPLDEGYSPPDRWSAGQGYGNTAWEEMHGESLAQRLRQEEIEDDPYEPEDPRVPDVSPYLWPREVGNIRSGRLLAFDLEDGGQDIDVTAWDVGIDGAGASAEVAAVHVIDDERWSL